MRLVLLATLAVVALCQTPRAALAQERVSPETAAAPTSTRDLETRPDPGATAAGEWYGWQTLTADVGSLGVMVVGGASTPVLIGLGAIGYLTVSPIIFATHGSDRWLTSLLLRLAVPTLMFGGAVVATGGCPILDYENESSCDRATGALPLGIAMTLGGLVLGIAMPIADAARAVDRRPSRSEHASVAITPWLTPHADAAGLALSGRL